MAKLRAIHWKKLERVVLFAGCTFKRKKGDHRIYDRPDLLRPVVFPEDKSIPIFIIRNNLRVLGISVEEYLEILGSL